ncbi:MAG: thiolase C-terminal domain-containing protein [Thermoplasmatota archaeon]
MRKVAIVGAGMSRWGVRSASWREMVQEAGKMLFDTTRNLDKEDIDSLIVGAAQPERFTFQAHVTPMVAEALGVTPRKVTMRTELACASGQCGIRVAYMAIATGMSDLALVVGAEKMNLPNMLEAQASMACVLDRDWEGVMGFSAPPFFAMVAQEHMRRYGTTREQLSLVSQKNHRFSSTNPYAHFQREYSLEEISGSLMVSPPLRLLDCSGITDGAAAVLLAPAESARKYCDTPAYIIGSGQCAMGNLIYRHRDMATWEPLKAAAKEAYRSARIGPGDLDFAEVHDCFTISEIMEYEELGLCEKGKGGKFIEEGQSDIGGRIPINTRGGLLGCGHPLGATGIGQAIEIFWQFNSLVPRRRQVPKAERALSHNLSGSANVHSILVYGRDGR